MFRVCPFRWAFVLLAFGPIGLVFGQTPMSPQAVWSGFDPRREPLEVEVMKQWSEHGARYTEFTFTGMTHEGSRVRVYAISSIPAGKTRLPAILHIHGRGQTVHPQWLRFWNSQGYAALTFNWGGVWPGRDRFTSSHCPTRPLEIGPARGPI